jgi:hypothetical protein
MHGAKIEKKMPQLPERESTNKGEYFYGNNLQYSL